MPQAQVLFTLLSELLGPHTNLGADAVNLAELMVAPHLDDVLQTPEWAASTATTPNIVSWLRRMNTRPEPDEHDLGGVGRNVSEPPDRGEDHP